KVQDLAPFEALRIELKCLPGRATAGRRILRLPIRGAAVRQADLAGLLSGAWSKSSEAQHRHLRRQRYLYPSSNLRNRVQIAQQVLERQLHRHLERSGIRAFSGSLRGTAANVLHDLWEGRDIRAAERIGSGRFLLGRVIEVSAVGRPNLQVGQHGE